MPLDEAVITNGSEIDTRKGAVEITHVDRAARTPKFFDGIFKLSPGRRRSTTLTLSEALDCKKAKARRSAAAKKPKTRKLWGDGKGKFRTKGTYSAATVRGTKWLVTGHLHDDDHQGHRGHRRRPGPRQEEDDRRAQGQDLHRESRSGEPQLAAPAVPRR